MKRLYFVADNIEATEKLAHNLITLKDLVWQYHVISKDESGLINRSVRSAHFWHKTDVIRQAEQGALIGIIIGIIGAGFYAAINPQHLPLPLTSWLISIFMPMFLFAWIGAVIGSRMQHYQLNQFEDELNYGGYIVIVDVPKENVDMVHQFIVSRSTELRQLGTMSAIPIPFSS
ncbi:hypothetical protein [Pleionea sediminis]|uniref:hypothetical protein n=1 Tax=Pleionea sediminis TaxID=2569479 RepID=UPI001185011E|nr:hypothetical protein [Pleionea sediminis]